MPKHNEHFSTFTTTINATTVPWYDTEKNVTTVDYYHIKMIRSSIDLLASSKFHLSDVSYVVISTCRALHMMEYSWNVLRLKLLKQKSYNYFSVCLLSS